MLYFHKMFHEKVYQCAIKILKQLSVQRYTLGYKPSLWLIKVVHELICSKNL